MVKLTLLHTYCSAEQSIMMSRKPAIASTFFQPLKPFTGLIWTLIAATILATSVVIYSFNLVYKKMKFPVRSKFYYLHDTIYYVRNVNIVTFIHRMKYFLSSCLENSSDTDTICGIFGRLQNPQNICTSSTRSLDAL